MTEKETKRLEEILKLLGFKNGGDFIDLICKEEIYGNIKRNSDGIILER